MSSLSETGPLPELPTVTTETRDGLTLVTIVVERRMHLRVKLNTLVLFDETVSDTEGGSGQEPIGVDSP